MARKSNSSLLTVSFNLRSTVVVYCKRIAAVAAAAVVVGGFVSFAVGKWKTTCRVLLASLLVLPCSHFFLLLSLFPLPLRLWVSLTLSSSRACSVALLAACHVRRRPRAVRMCGPLSTRIHQTFLHHVLCLFDTSFSSCVEFASFFASTLSLLRCHLFFSFVPFLGLNFSFFSSRPLSFSFSRLTFSLALSTHFFLLLFLSLLFFLRLLRSLLLSGLLRSLPLPPALFSPLPPAPPALSSLPHAPRACFLPIALNPVVSHSSAPLALSLPLSLSLSLLLLLFLAVRLLLPSLFLSPVLLPPVPSSSSQTAHLIPRVSLLSGTDMARGV